MSIVTPHTDFFRLLEDTLEYLESVTGEYDCYDLIERIRVALDELEGFE